MDGNIEKMQSLTGRIKGLGIDKTLTKKGMCAEAEATGEALATKVSITDIVDDFLSVATDKPLSANQGRILKKQIDEIDPHYAENVIYGDTNVKDAIDKLSKAENIAYDEEKSVQGAIDEVQVQMGNIDTRVGNTETQVNTINNRLFAEGGNLILKSGFALELRDGSNRGVWLTYNNSWSTDKSYIIPTKNKSINIGKNDFQLSNVYCESVTQSSDRRMKNSVDYDIGDMIELINNLKPCSFKYNDSDNTQYGLIAQDVRDYLIENNKEFSGLIIDKAENCNDEFVDKNTDENNVIYGLDYTKFIPCLIATIQSQQSKIDELEERLARVE